MNRGSMELPRRLKELRDGIEENRRATLEMVERLTETEWAFREAGEWSIAEILEHLVIAEIGRHEELHRAQIGTILRKLGRTAP